MQCDVGHDASQESTWDNTKTTRDGELRRMNDNKTSKDNTRQRKITQDDTGRRNNGTG